MAKNHIKHTPLVKPSGGKFHSNEIGILGAPCSIIQDLSTHIVEGLVDRRVSYIDADHGQDESTPIFHSVYTDKISHHALEFSNGQIDYRYRSMFSDSEAVIINGNHFSSDKQVVVIHPAKEDSLRRKLDRLTDVRLFILAEGATGVFPFIFEHYPEYRQIPVLNIGNLEDIQARFKDVLFGTKPVIKGLVFAGGKSTRMGKDKGSVVYHKKPQREHMADLLTAVCDEVFISVAPGTRIESSYSTIEDTFIGLGPYGGILSAFRNDPNAAWFTVACDIPLLGTDVLQQLSDSRDPSKMATCFHNPETDFPEPLITIWEPRAYHELLYFLSTGYSCPRKALINSDIKEIKVKDPKVLMNANTPEELEELMGLINS